MITINTEKQLIRVDDWATLVERAGFTDDLDPKQHELKAIIGRYAFKDKLRCGLSSCHTPHNRGYIVATKSGLETNIGKDCGKTHFGVDFNDMSRQFERDITEKENRETLWSFHFRLDEILQTIDDIRRAERGADWVYRRSRPLIELNKGCPEKIVRRIGDMLKTGTSIVTVSREATKEEIDAKEARTGRQVRRPYYVDEPAGEIANLHVLYCENDLREILVLDLETKSKGLSNLDIDTMTYEQLLRWVKWVGTVEEKLQRAQDTVASGRQFLTAENLSCLSRIVSSDDDVRAFNEYLKSLA
ncbi:hypothetical protein LBW59_24490 [Ralstonia solanacearum]|uniref:Uncharacterized protein n=1 Tax=Ralstonia solanacearum TaxID=305 RepID=A0AAW5ZVI1_RALSL|nr:hypothetical protein [Ralstonia solanacearum]MDB0573904.1 hypothetical protein [Ralstonia solanacearum]